MEFLNRVILSLTFCQLASGIMWDRIRCSSDADQNVPEGRIPEIGRFPWLGVVQHSFYIGGKTRFAITTGVLIHPAYVVAPAEDMAKVQRQALANNTKFIVWQKQTVKYTMDVLDFYLHPEYEERLTFATLALLMLGTNGEVSISDFVAPVMPVCLPVKGSGAYADLFVVKITDDKGELHKEMFEVNIVDNKDCEEFYFRAKLNYKMMSPVNSICVVTEGQQQSCVWDGGAVLISRQSWGFWRLIGVGVRGPGCGAPSRFLSIHDYIMWMDEIISQYPYESYEQTHKFALRRLSPTKFIMYKADVKLPGEIGFCARDFRGAVIYKDSTEIALNKNFAQGFFFVSLAQIASVHCATILLDVSSRTNLAVWLEHHCYKELTGDRRGYKKRRQNYKDIRPMECFLYFKTVAYLEFRFYFSFKALLEVTVYGIMEEPRIIPNPYKSSESTENWWPTDYYIKWGNFMPYYKWTYGL